MKRVLLTAFSAFIVIGLKAQFFYSNNQQIIKDAVINSLVIVEQSYQLEDTITHRLYGRNNQPEFGKLRGLAVKIKNGYLVNKNLLSPWAFDENCIRYLNQYKGVISKTSMYEISDTIVHHRDIVFREAIASNQHLALIGDTLFHNIGFSQSQSINKTEGWLVWLTAKKDIQDLKSGDDVIYQIYKTDLNLSIDSLYYNIAAPITENKVIGGIFIVPKLAQIGLIEFYLSGLALDINGTWKIVLNRFGEANPIISSEEREDIGLTPVNSSDSEKKNKKNKKNKRQ